MFSENRIKYIHFFGLVIVLMGISVLIGWQFDIVFLKSFTTEMTSMNPLTAVTFIVSGIWLFTFEEYNFKISNALLGLFVLTIGILHSSAHQFSLEFLRLDHLLFQSKVDESNINSHIAFITSLLFLLCGSIMISSYSKNSWVLSLRQIIIIIVFTLSYISILG